MREQRIILRRQTPERGAALLTVLVALMIITILLFEFQYASMVERKLAYNDLNQTQAYYLAKSGVRIGLLRIALYARLKNNPQLKNLVKDPSLLDPFLTQIWQLPIPPFPPDAGDLNKMFKADRDAAQKVLSQTKITQGKYSTVIKSESSKINLNSLIVPKAQLGQRPNFSVPPTRPDMHTALLLVNLLEGFIRESEDPYEEYPDLRPEELVMDIMDWVNPGDVRFAGGSKDSYYQQQKPPYRAKRGKFFTVEELRMVKGMDEHIFEKLKPYVTVYSYDSKININTANQTLYRAIYKDFTDDDLKRIMEQRAELGSWANEQQFVNFVTQTLGRSGFTTLYNNPAEYPFTVGTESFSIEALGIIQKSASSVQRTINTAVAFTAGRGCEPVPNATTQPECIKTPGRFWFASIGQCYTDPQNASECTNRCGGTAMQQGGKEGCKINQTAPTPPIFRVFGGTTGGKKAAGNSMKILHWQEA